MKYKFSFYQDIADEEIIDNVDINLFASVQLSTHTKDYLIGHGADVEIKEIDDQPIGKLIEAGYGTEAVYECSVCHEEFNDEDTDMTTWKYCPICGTEWGNR